MNAFPLIFDIHHFALDDGPGIRTTVFLKGCPLSCVWCHNPESIKRGPETSFHTRFCIECGACRDTCQQQAITFDTPGRIVRSKCMACGACTECCPASALRTVGKYYSPDELFKMLLSDRVFYDTSGGGVTFSGGEPTVFMDYVGEVMKALKKNHIHVAIQTSGVFDLSEFKEKLLPHIDLIYFDIKLFDPHKHKTYTGRSNEEILGNFTELYSQSAVTVVPTIPLVPNITATEHNLTSIAKFLRAAGCFTYELKPYNPGGISKRVMIGEDVPQDISEIPMRMEEQESMKAIFECVS